MKISPAQLEQLLELQRLELEAGKLKTQITELASGKSLESLRDEILFLSQTNSQERINFEELEREQARTHGDLKLVEDRIIRDKDRLNKTAVARDALGIQHELETLNKRKSELEDMELAVMGRLEESKKLMDDNSKNKSELERGFEKAKADLQQKLLSDKAAYDLMFSQLRSIRDSLVPELLELYQTKALRGVAVGRMLRNTCGACNMGLTASAAHDLLSKPDDELVTCPECGAILVRN